MKGSLVTILLLAVLAGGSLAAPLEPLTGQGSDAVSLLRAWGLVEGYPGAGFRGARATSRYETALVLARALAKLEATNKSFLTADQLQTLREIRNEYQEELVALGVRTDSVGEDLRRLDERVSERERILFSGEFSSRYVGQSFTNTGNTVSGPGGANYDALVGALGGANFLPHGPLGILPVIDYGNGRPLTNGTGFTSTLFLDMNILLKENWQADLRLFARTNQGNQLIDAVWGTPAPYLANPFTGTTGLNDRQGRDRTPFTTAGFESLNVSNGEDMLFTLGRFEPKILNPTVFPTPVNPNPNGPDVLGGFGLRGWAEFDSVAVELFGTKLPDGNLEPSGPLYDTNALGGSVQYFRDNLTVNANFLRVSNESSQGLPLVVGQVGPFNGTTGALYANWVNPPDYFVNQLGGVGSPFVAGSGTVSDKRPVPGLANSDAFNRQATLGPQAQTSVGVSALWEPGNWTVLADYALSQYRPNKNSDYSVTDSLWRLGAERIFFDEALKLGLEYRYTGPSYDPFVLSFPTTVTGTPVFRAYHRLPSFDQFWHLYSLHNTADFPHNRKGFWIDTEWRYDPDGVVRFQYRNLQQVRSSLQNIRFSQGSAGPNLPNADVLGFSPGFTDIVFREYSPRSFDAALNPLEDRLGGVESVGVELEHIFTGTPWRVDLDYEVWNFHRPSELPARLGGSQNLVDLKASTGRLSVGRSMSRDLLLTVGYERSALTGHYDPAGIYNSFATANQTTDFKNRDTVQHVPFVAVDWQISSGMNLRSGVRYYSTVDGVSSVVGAGAPAGPNSQAHPFNWKGVQVTTALNVKF